MFLSFIPAWIAALLLYGGSKRQRLFEKSLPKHQVIVFALILMALSLNFVMQNFPTVSALLAVLGLVCCFLPAVTIVSAYGKLRIFQLSGVIILSSLTLTFLGVS